MAGMVVAILVVFGFILKPLISISVNEDLARVDGTPVARVRFTFMVLLALVIAVALKVVGILLITALLIIPAATARMFSKSPLQMVMFAIIISELSVFLGLYSSLQFDLPAGAAIVVAAMLLFLISRLVVKSPY